MVTEDYAEFETELTPTVIDPCPECGQELVRVKDDVRPPCSYEEAITHTRCEATRSRIWSWCARSFWLKICFDKRQKDRFRRR